MYNGKNVEIYIGHIDTESVDFSSRANDTTLASFIDGEITGTNITDFVKISNGTTEFNIEPQEDESENTLFIGVDSNGAQNSYTSITPNADVNITLTKAGEIVDTLKKYILEDSGITNATYSDYESFNWGSINTDKLILVFRKKVLVNGTYKFGTIAVVAPDFTNIPNVSVAADDNFVSAEIPLIGKKGMVFEDFYSDTSDETLSNF